MHKISKANATILIAVLILLPLLSTIPIPVSATITGKPTLYKVTSHTENAWNSLVPGSLTDGAIIQTHINSYDSGDLVAINITGMTITGAQVWLYISETGGATIDPGDVWYAGPLPLSSIIASVPSGNYSKTTDAKSGQRFWLGNNGIIGPLPAGSTVPRGVNYYVKIVDVLPSSSIPSSDVAVSVNQWKPYESISITPSSGPVGTTIKVNGMAWDNTKKLNVSYANSNSATTPVVIPLITPYANGTFTATFVVAESKLFNAETTKYVNAYYNGTVSVLATKTYTENERRWLQVAGTLGPGGNDFVDGSVKVNAAIYISVNFTNPGGTATLYWDYGASSQVTLISGITVNSVTGFFNVSVTVPVSKMGTHKITLVDLTYNMNATVTVVPTLILTPSSGPIGTSVSATGYGFPYANANNVTIQWDFTDYNAKQVVNLVYKVYTGSNGQFATSFIVPTTVGGDHNVGAFSNETVPTIANATFSVTILLTVSPASPINNGTEVTITGTGLAYPAYYDLCVDYSKDFFTNSSSGYPKYFMGSSKGVLSAFKIVIGAGFSPGKHVIALYKMGASSLLPTLDAYKLFTVVGEAENAILDKLTAIDTTLNSLKSYVNSTSTGLPSLKTQLTAIQTAVADAQSALTTQISGLSTRLVSIETYAQTAATSAATAASAASAASTSAASAKTAAEAASAATSTISTAVYGAIVLSLIAALASIVAVITLQKKVA